ncbi:MFS transporter [Emticicia sp. BO119]|uniref:MFS transporter n=1 Tax=Emticicia sp. BO119 TaxID=2757768 RepID=UPI0015F0E284|nr:MFS transporter [Emticicia sp. BO119]MBA4853160.1 MFS transporter [Emticicia sp. BO119]
MTLITENNLKQEVLSSNIRILAFILCLISYAFGGTVSTLMSVYLPVAIPELLDEKISEARLGEEGAYISAISLYGWMIGGILFGVVSDKIGRKKVLVLVTGLYGLATLLTVFVTNWYILLACRFFTGMGVGGVLLVTTVYISEIWIEKTRPVFVGILAIAFPLGIVASGGLSKLFSEWHNAFWIGLIPAAIAILIAVLLPESPKWQNLKNVEQTSSGSLFDNSYRPNLIKGSIIFGAVLIGLWGIFSWLPTWVQTLLPAGQTGQNERGNTMMLLGLGGIAGGILSGFLIQTLGNRKTLMLTFISLIVASCLLFLTNKTFTPVIYVETALLTLCFGISQGSLSSYIPELFPTIIRATATGFCFNVGRFFTATAVFFVGALVTVFGGFGNALLAFSSTFIVAFIMACFSKEKEANLINS